MAPPYHFIVFGEDINDQQAIQNLIRAVLPKNLDARVAIRRQPTILSRDATRKHAEMSQRIASFWRAERNARGGKVIVVAHRDCDNVEPSHIHNSSQLSETIRAAGVTDVVAATPAWEIETWWMMFPEAISAVRPCWRRVNYDNRNIGLINNSKERLTRDLRPTNKIMQKRCRDFNEADGIAISKIILERDLINLPHRACDSFALFCSDLMASIQTKPNRAMRKRDRPAAG